MGWGTKINIHFPFTFIKQLNKCIGEKERQKVGRSSLGHISQITCFCQQISKTNFIFLGSLPGTRSKSDKGSSKLQNEVQKPESSVEGLLGTASRAVQNHCWAGYFLRGFQSFSEGRHQPPAVADLTLSVACILHI